MVTNKVPVVGSILSSLTGKDNTADIFRYLFDDRGKMLMIDMFNYLMDMTKRRTTTALTAAPLESCGRQSTLPVRNYVCQKTTSKIATGQATIQFQHSEKCTSLLLRMVFLKVVPSQVRSTCCVGGNMQEMVVDRLDA
jgi:hypothetical protein